MQIFAYHTADAARMFCDCDRWDEHPTRPMWDLEVFSAASVTEAPRGSLSAQAEYVSNEQRKEDSRALHLFRRDIISGEHEGGNRSGRPELRNENGINGFDATWESGEWELEYNNETDFMQANSAIGMHLPDGVYVTPVNKRFEVDKTTEIQYCRHQRGSEETAISAILHTLSKACPGTTDQQEKDQDG